MIRLILSIALVFSLTINLNAQRTCGSMDHLNHLKEQDPNLEQRMEEMESRIQTIIENNNYDRATVITIPVVVHVVYSTSSQNISNAQIQSQIDVLNEDFRRMNADAANTHSRFTNVAADVQIEFCLANTDPNGNATTGITRTQTSTSSFSSNDYVKYSSYGGKNAWSTDKYLNLWVCNLGSSLLGYAQFPGSGSAATDGVVINYKYFGRGGSAQAPFNKGRTATHEVGHWLNLRHIWGDASCGNDYVSDTPTQQQSSSGCPSSSQYTCGSYDMTQNYMDYSDDGCMNLFTAGQASRMRALFSSGGARVGLLTSNGCSGGTTGGGNTTTTYCASKGNDASYEWIANVTLGSINNTSANNGGYKDFTAISTNLEKGGSYTISLAPGFAQSAYNEYWKVWIDFNGDNDFGDSGELVFDAGSMSQSTVTGTINVPTSVASGAKRMRVQMKYNGAGTACEAFDYGEVEDYTVNITEATVTCNTPTGHTASNISQTSTTISWSSTGATSYTIAYRASGAANWSSTTSTSTSKNITGLTAATTYEYAVRSECNGTSGDFTSVKTFTTQSASTGGGNTGGTTTGYCASKGNDASYEWIANVNLGTINNASGTNGGYADFTSKITDLVLGSTNAITLVPGFSGQAYNEYWKVWIDYNKDGDFNDAGELAYDQGGMSTGTVNGQINVPQSVTIGSTRMRVQMKYNAAGTACEAFDYGEVEDYTVNIVEDNSNPAVTYCTSKGNNSNYEWIQSVKIGNATKTSGNNGGYKDYTASTFSVIQGTTYSVVLTPGFASSTYNEYWKVWIDYNADGDFDDSGELVFNPGSMSSSAVNGQITIASNAASGVTRMRVQMKYNAAGSACESFSYGEVEDYTVVVGASSREGMVTTTEDADVSGRFNTHMVDSYEISVYPNPAKDAVSINFDGLKEAKVTIVDQQGRLVDSFNYLDDGFSTQTLDLYNYNSGIYFIMVSNDEFTSTKRLVVVD